MGLVTHNKNKYDEGTKISEYFSIPELVQKPLNEPKNNKKTNKSKENKKNNIKK